MLYIAYTLLVPCGGCTHSRQKFVHPKVMHITPMLNTLNESQHIYKLKPGYLISFIFLTEYERKYSYDAI